MVKKSEEIKDILQVFVGFTPVYAKICWLVGTWFILLVFLCD